MNSKHEHGFRWATRSIRLATIIGAASLSAAIAQAQSVTVNGGVGVVYRYSADTIWRQRDTSMTRTVFRGDTAERSLFVNEIMTSSTRYLVRGDSAIAIERRDRSGKVVAGFTSSLQLVSLESDRTIIEQTQAMAAMDALRNPNFPPRPTIDPPVSPATWQVYAISANKIITQIRDTVVYITGCSARPPVDSTVYQVFGADSVRRLAPSPRTFGPLMVQAITADMSIVMARQRLKDRNDPAAPKVPRLAKWPCDLRP